MASRIARTTVARCLANPTSGSSFSCPEAVKWHVASDRQAADAASTCRSNAGCTLASRGLSLRDGSVRVHHRVLSLVGRNDGAGPAAYRRCCGAGRHVELSVRITVSRPRSRRYAARPVPRCVVVDQVGADVPQEVARPLDAAKIRCRSWPGHPGPLGNVRWSIPFETPAPSNLEGRGEQQGK